MSEILKTLIEELVREATARPESEPRTGNFHFLDSSIDEIMAVATKLYKDIRNDIVDPKKIHKMKFAIPSPISGKTYQIPVWFFWNGDRDSEMGSMKPYDSGRGRIRINIIGANDPGYLRSVIFHELVHLYDPQIMKGITDQNDGTLNNDDYWQTPREKKAYLQQYNYEMIAFAKKLARDIKAGFATSKNLARTLEKKPLGLVSHVANKEHTYKNILQRYQNDTNWIKSLYRSAFDISRAYLTPALKEADAKPSVRG